MENYDEIRNNIRETIQFLEQKQFTQAEIAKQMTDRVEWKISARDINFLKNVRNNRWKGPAKSHKLSMFHQEISHFRESVKNHGDQYHLITNVKNIIRKCLQAEFEFYKTIPDLKLLNTLHIYHDENGRSLREIKERFERLKQRKWIIHNKCNPSYYDLIELSILSLGPDIIKIKTKENWYLKWFGMESGKYEYLYNHCNHQEYTLTNIDFKWKITSIVYDTHQKRQPPPFNVPPLSLKVKNKEELKKQISKQIYVGNTERALEIVIGYAKAKKIKTLSTKMVVLRNSLIEITRLINTESITLSEYLSKRNSINEVLLLI